MLLGLPLLLVVVAGVTWLVTRRALRPVEGIRGEMAAITASTDLSRRVPVPSSKDAIGRLARTTNETLAALESAVERQRRFVADASHELRSPIASLRTQLEVGVAHPELLDVPGAVEDTVRLQRLAADLLLLARLDAGERPGGTRVDLAAMVREESSQRVADRVPVRTGELASAEVAGSRGQLGRVLGNLLDNAQRHAVASVRVAVVREGSGRCCGSRTTGPGCRRASGSGSSSGSSGSMTHGPGTTAGPGWGWPSRGMSRCGTGVRWRCARARCSSCGCRWPDARRGPGGAAPARSGGRGRPVRGRRAPCGGARPPE